MPTNETLLDFLVRRYPTAKRQTLKRMVQGRRVMLNGKPVLRMEQRIVEGDEVRIDEMPRPVAVPEIAPLELVYEDQDVVVVNKPAGLLTSTVPREKRPTALAILRNHYAGERAVRLGLIHRLDRDASGLLVFSKTDDAYKLLKSQFFHHTVERTYAAVVEGKPSPAEGTIISDLVELPDGKVRTTKKPGAGQRAVTHYRKVETKNGRSLVEVSLETGRKHQIRVHLSEKGWPIVNDAVYGKRGEGDLMLMAIRLAFEHPATGKRKQFEIKCTFTVSE